MGSLEPAAATREFNQIQPDLVIGDGEHPAKFGHENGERLDRFGHGRQRVSGQVWPWESESVRPGLAMKASRPEVGRQDSSE